MMRNLCEGTYYEQIKKQAEERCFTNKWTDGNHRSAGNSRTPYSPTFALTDNGASSILPLLGQQITHSTPLPIHLWVDIGCGQKSVCYAGVNLWNNFARRSKNYNIVF